MARVLGVCGEVCVDGERIEVNGRLLVLLAVLAVRGRRGAGRAELVDLLWPEDQPAAGGRALNPLLSRLRRVVGPIDGRGVVRLDAETHVDLAAALAALGRAIAEPDAETALTLATAAARTLRGPLAPGCEHPWVDAQRAALRERHADALTVAAQAGARITPIPAAALDAARELVAAHPLDERPTALLMDLLVAAGDRSAALRAYEATRARLRAELAIAPGPELRTRHLRLLDSDTPPPDTSPASPLPPPLAVAGWRPRTEARLRAELVDAGHRQAALLIALTHDAAIRGDVASAIDHARGAREFSGDHPELEASALAVEAWALCSDGRRDEALLRLDRAAQLLDAVGDDAVAADPQPLHALVAGLHFAECQADALRHAQRAIAVARDGGDTRYLAEELACAAGQALLLGREALATELAEAAVARARVDRNDAILAWGLACVSATRLLAGDTAGARASADAAHAVAVRTAHPPLVAPMLAAWTTQALVASGDPRLPAERLRALAGPSSPHTWQAFWQSLVGERMVCAALAAGDLAAADAWAAHARIHAMSPTSRACADGAAARVALARGDGAAAAAQLAARSFRILDLTPHAEDLEGLLGSAPALGAAAT
jgi:DNA-binding SARP family transcriptional activator